MIRARGTKVLAAIAGCALVVGALGVNASGAAGPPKFKTSGSAQGSIDTNGAFSATVLGTGGGYNSTTTVSGQLSANSGIGTKSLMGTATAAGSDGSFSGPVADKKNTVTATVAGTVTKDGAFVPLQLPGISVKCVISYPPLKIVCTIKLIGSTSSL